MNGFTGLGTALLALITKAIPSDTQRLELMKENQPWAYYILIKHMARNIARFLKHNPQVPRDTAEKLFSSALPADQQTELEAVVNGILADPQQTKAATAPGGAAK